MADDRDSTGGEHGWPFQTPTGAPCPRTVRQDGSVEGSGHCLGCGACLLFGGLIEVAWPGER